MMTKEKYMTLGVSVLRGLAKSRGLKNTSKMKKDELVEAMLNLDEKEQDMSLSVDSEDSDAAGAEFPEESEIEEAAETKEVFEPAASEPEVEESSEVPGFSEVEQTVSQNQVKSKRQKSQGAKEKGISNR
ncbi:MAG TPA: Rho termination factor N-terminal domain-containing protein, partial [Lachnospiraceae bacterium]|nr:Rho termination factor N-terminal domain-containing protein [Lachnospiraceae bacterium]